MASTLSALSVGSKVTVKISGLTKDSEASITLATGDKSEG